MSNATTGGGTFQLLKSIKMRGPTQAARWSYTCSGIYTGLGSGNSQLGRLRSGEFNDATIRQASVPGFQIAALLLVPPSPHACRPVVMIAAGVPLQAAEWVNTWATGQTKLKAAANPADAFLFSSAESEVMQTRVMLVPDTYSTRTPGATATATNVPVREQLSCSSCVSFAVTSAASAAVAASYRLDAQEYSVGCCVRDWMCLVFVDPVQNLKIAPLRSIRAAPSHFSPPPTGAAGPAAVLLQRHRHGNQSRLRPGMDAGGRSQRAGRGGRLCRQLQGLQPQRRPGAMLPIGRLHQAQPCAQHHGAVQDIRHVGGAAADHAARRRPIWHVHQPGNKPSIRVHQGVGAHNFRRAGLV